MAVCESSSCLLLCEHFEFEQLYMKRWRNAWLHIMMLHYGLRFMGFFKCVFLLQKQYAV